MNNQDLLCIEDDQQRKLYYRFTPAKLVSNFVPLVVILDTEATHFEYKMWNVLTPLDTFNYEKGDLFLKDLLQKLIQQIADQYECEDHIYLYGNSMGGYGAILHGILCKANAVFAHTPHIRLADMNNTSSKENDLRNLLNSHDSFPIFYLCNNEDETAYFVDICKKHDIKVHLDFCPKSENDKTHALKEVLNMFERVTS